MATNPMQRKARNSFLLGVFITLLIAIIFGVLFFMLFLKDKLKTYSDNEEVVAYVYKLKVGANVESGDLITKDMVEEVKTTANAVPSDVLLAKIQNSDGVLVNRAFPEGYKSKIALKQGTVLGAGMLYKDDLTDDTLRLVEFNMITLPSTIHEGEYVDVRITLPSGNDYIVLSKKCIQKVKGETIGLYLNEQEIITMSCAIIDAYTTKASNIYLAKYVESGIQKDAEQTYVVKQSIIEEMTKNPNILQEAKTALAERWNNNGSLTRINIEASLSSALNEENPREERINNLEEKMEQQISKSKELYLSGLEGY